MSEPGGESAKDLTPLDALPSCLGCLGQFFAQAAFMCVSLVIGGLAYLLFGQSLASADPELVMIVGGCILVGAIFLFVGARKLLRRGESEASADKVEPAEQATKNSQGRQPLEFEQEPL